MYHMKNNKSSTRGLSLEISVLARARAQLLNVLYIILSLPPCLPVGYDRYLNLSSQKRPTGWDLGGNRSVRHSGTTFRGTVVLVFCLRMRRFPLTLVLTIFVGINELRRVKCSRHLLAPDARLSKVPKLFGCFSSDIILFVSSKQRYLEARNFAVI